MRAILIDPKEQTITEVEYNEAEGYKDILKHIDASCFDCVHIGDPHRHTLFVDDEGLINGRWQQDGMFRFDGDNPAYLAGKGLILATNSEGESVEAKLDIEWVKSQVVFGLPISYNGAVEFFEVTKDRQIVKTARHWSMD